MNSVRLVTCEDCGLTFAPSWSDADAIMEYQENFTEEQRCDPEGTMLVCDDCYRVLMAKARALGIVA